MKTWMTSDTHLGHARIIELCDRPFGSVEEMDEQLLANINETVPDTDRLVLLGDNIMGNWENGLSLVSRMTPAELVFLPGNHDKWSRVHNKPARREKKAAELREARDNVIVLLEDEDWELTRSWDFCQLSDEWLNNPLDNAQFSHYPYEGESWDGREDRYKELRPVEVDIPVVCGHVHTAWAERGNQMNVGVDVRGFYPVSEDKIAEWLQTL